MNSLIIGAIVVLYLGLLGLVVYRAFRHRKRRGTLRQTDDGW